MIITNVQTITLENGFKLSATVRPETARRGEFEVWFEVQGLPAPATPTGDPFLAGFLIPCMWAGEDLRIEAPVSARLLGAVPTIQALIGGWYPEFGRITVTAAGSHEALATVAPGNGAPGRASMFSGGVDSWYTVLKHEAAITHLVLIHGYDIKASERNLWRQTRQSLHDVAAELGKTPVTVHTNLKKSADPRYASWGRPYKGLFWRHCYQGSALAAAALCAQESLGEIMIPSTYAADRLRPWGSHPELDVLWSTENLTVTHDGIEAGRMAKILSRVGHSPVALRHLRVCLENVPGMYNCCRCLKCINTMLDLAIAGTLDQAVTFARPLTLKEVRRVYVSKDSQPIYREIGVTARAAGLTDLADAIAVSAGGKFAVDHVWSITRHHLAVAALAVAPPKIRSRLKTRIGHWAR